MWASTGLRYHDFELAMISATTESVARYISAGQFGLWQKRAGSTTSSKPVRKRAMVLAMPWVSTSLKVTTT